MIFTKRLREPVMRGEVTTSIRIWQKPHVKVGGAYALGAGHIRVTSIAEIGVHDITPEMARASGFAGVVDLLKIAKHGPGERVYVVTFHYEPDTPLVATKAKKAKKANPRKRKARSPRNAAARGTVR